MDANSWRAAQPLSQAQGGDVAGIAAGPAAPAPASGALETGDWRAQLQPDSRQRIVNKIMETLKRHLPFSGQEGLQELKKIAVRFEEKIYAAATNQSDYLRKISLKMLSMETKSAQNPMANPLQANIANSSQNAQGSHTMQPQVINQAQPLSVTMVSNQSQARQQQPSQNIQNTITSSGVLPSAGSLTQTNIPNAVGQNSNLQNVQGIPAVAQSSVGNTMGHSNVVANSIRQMQERQQQVVSQQQQQSQAPNTHLYQHQLRQQMLKQKFQSQVQQQHEQQQPNLLQQTQMQSSQQGVMQPSTAQSNLSNLQQNQQSPVQQQSQPMIQQRSQSVLRQHQQQQTPIIHQQQGTMMQQPMIQSQQQQSQQQHLIGQQQNVANIQQNQSIGQQTMSDMQHQQTRLMGLQNNYTNVQQQQLVNQQVNVPSVHQQQIGTQGNVSGLSHQQQLAGNQSSSSGLTANQHPVQMSQHSNVQVQQQMLPSATLLPAQGLQSQPQQQMLPQNPSQPGTLQPPLGLQQQSNAIQREMQQRLQTPNPMLQQNMIDQQKQNFQPQRGTPEPSSTSLDSTAQTGSIHSGDWREEAYHKLKCLKETYFMDLNELFHKISSKVAQHDSLPQQPKNDQMDKIKQFKHMIEQLLHTLTINKNDIQPQHKDKLAQIERQIIYFLSPNRTRKPQPSQNFDGQINLQSQSLNLPSTMASMQQNNLNNMQQHNPLSSITAVSNSQQNMPSSMHNGASMDMIGQGSSLSSLQQVSSGALHQNSINGPQQMNLSSFSSHGGANSLQTNHQENSNMLQHPRQHDQQMLQNQQLRQQIQQRQIQQQIFQKQQLLQQQQQQIKQAQVPQAAQSMTQLHQMVDTTNDLKMRQHIGGNKSGVFQQHQPLGPRVALHHSQLNSSISSPQFHQTSSPQLSQHPSPQFEQQNALASHTKMGTPLQSASSPFALSPSTPFAPSSMSGDFDKISMGAPSLLGPGNIGIQQTTSASAQSLAIDTPGISTSPLLPENNSLDGTHANLSTSVSGKSTVEQPIGRLINAVRTLSTKALSTSVSDISSVISMMDRIAGSAPGNGSRAAVGEDLVAMTKCRLHARNFYTHDGPTGAKRMKCYTTSNVVSSSGSASDGFALWNCTETSDLQSTATSSIQKLKVNHALIEEIREINQRLIDTVVEISDEPSVLASATDGGEGGTMVKCSFMAVALSPNLKSQCALAQMSPIQSLRLLVPANYPNCSPIFIDSFPVEVSKEYENLSGTIRSRLSTTLRSLSQPMSLGDIARAWDCCTRATISDNVQQCGGGSFSSKYGTWEDCMTTAA
ncbi:unnamed protein product [Cuscuta epithymum]|uniref:Mediator complex subunit 15 KIX domain-containing protein n=2 Tax=Cuscuta epithymum TaxID=186058 RepID=A0AAV0DFB1_9ASTE|nr:unnamed protein product [Cuscuta epithymum]